MTEHLGKIAIAHVVTVKMGKYVTKRRGPVNLAVNQGTREYTASKVRNYKPWFKTCFKK